MTRALSPEMFPLLREFLRKRGFSFESRPHQEFLARGPGAVVNLYTSGKVVIGGPSPQSQTAIVRYLQSIAPEAEFALPDARPTETSLNFHETRVGIDEAGKGDYFGPLVACAVLATEQQAQEMLSFGVRDSKRLSGDRVKTLATWIRTKCLREGQCRIVRIPPPRYNILMTKMKDLNRLLGWAHARALEEVLKFPEPCTLAIADQFGNPKYLQDALFTKGQGVRLVQTPKGERDVVVAAASILARDDFVTAMRAMCSRFKEDFPLGASQVEDFGHDLVRRKGEGILLETAKVHFSTTARLIVSTNGLEKELARLVALES
jgi:ribonuclease HIII